MYTDRYSAGKNSRFNRMHTYTGIDGDTLGGEDTSGLYSPAAKDTNVQEQQERTLKQDGGASGSSQPPREVRRGQRGHQCMYFNWQNETHSRATTTTNSPRFYFFCFGLSARLYQQSCDWAIVSFSCIHIEHPLPLDSGRQLRKHAITLQYHNSVIPCVASIRFMWGCRIGSMCPSNKVLFEVPEGFIIKNYNFKKTPEKWPICELYGEYFDSSKCQLRSCAHPKWLTIPQFTTTTTTATCGRH